MRRSKLPPKIALASSTPTPRRESASHWRSNTAVTQPRGKNDESVPNSSRCGPATSRARSNTCSRVGGGARYFVHVFEEEVSKCTLGHNEAVISASRKYPAPKCGTMKRSFGDCFIDLFRITCHLDCARRKQHVSGKIRG